MRNLAMGSVGVLFGLFVVGGSFLMGDEKPPPGQKQDGAFKVGQMVGTVFGFLLLGVGAYYVYRGVMDVREDREEDALLYDRPRKKQKKTPRPTRIEGPPHARPVPGQAAPGLHAPLAARPAFEDDDGADEPSPLLRRRTRAVSGIPAFVWWLGGGFIALFLICVAIIVMALALPAFQRDKTIAPGTIISHDEIVSQFGRDKVIIVHCVGINKFTAGISGRTIRERFLRALGRSPDDSEAVFVIEQANHYVVYVVVLKEPQELARRIDFAKVLKTDTDNRMITIEFDARQLAELRGRDRERGDGQAAPPPPKNPPDIAKLLDEIQNSRNAMSQREALEALAELPPNDRRRDVVKAVERHLANPNPLLQEAALRAYVVWADQKDAVAKLIEFLRREASLLKRREYLRRLGALGDQSAIPAVAERLTDFSVRNEAMAALREFGPPAETEVRKYLRDKDPQVRSAACQVLKDIGTRASLPELKDLVASGDLLVKAPADRAVRAIEEREKAGARAKEEKAPSKPADSPPRLAGLIAHWSFDDDDGEVVKDKSGNGLHARLIGCKRGEGVRGKGVEMTGKDQYVNLGTSPLLNFGAGAPFTVSLWLRSDQRDATILAFREERSGAPVISVNLGPFGIQATVRSDGSESGEAAVREMRRGLPRWQTTPQWEHVALTRSEGGEIELFVDGVSAGRGRGANAAGSITTDLRALGNERYWKRTIRGGNPDFIGRLDEVQIHGRVLSAEEIRALATK
jgi:hypothetical protein